MGLDRVDTSRLDMDRMEELPLPQIQQGGPFITITILMVR
jgi:hypothetical protein